jgi:NADH-quinone oxidoreductase subunit D
LTMNYITPGGVMNDLHPTFVKTVKALIKQFKVNIHEYDKLLTGNIIFQKRTQDVGILSKELAISLGASGPVARASGVNCDVRKLHPYDGYEKLDFKEIVMDKGDSFTRYLVRIEEMKQSMHIIDQLIDNIPEGDFRLKSKALIRLPEGEYYQRVETARGELGVYIVSDGNKSPYRIKYRTPNFSNLGALQYIAKGSKIGDLVAIMATLDLIIPDIDR